MERPTNSPATTKYCWSEIAGGRHGAPATVEVCYSKTSEAARFQLNPRRVSKPANSSMPFGMLLRSLPVALTKRDCPIARVPGIDFSLAVVVTIMQHHATVFCFAGCFSRQGLRMNQLVAQTVNRCEDRVANLREEFVSMPSRSLRFVPIKPGIRGCQCQDMSIHVQT